MRRLARHDIATHPTRDWPCYWLRRRASAINAFGDGIPTLDMGATVGKNAAMPVRTALWKVGSKPEALKEGTLATELLLEDMIVANPRLVSDEWMLIGRQVDTGLGGRVDLIAIAPDGSLVLIELKRDRTPREVVAQAIDYASWLESLRPEMVAQIYDSFTNGRSIADDFAARFGLPLDEETLNGAHQIVIVAGSLDASSERIVKYLNQRDIGINVLCFQVFNTGSDQLLSRSWLLDPVRVQAASGGTTAGPTEPWNGEFYCSFGQGESRDWDEAVRYGFVSGGGGAWYSRTLSLLQPGDRVWVKVPATGFVGVGRVTGPSTPAREFQLLVDGKEQPALEVLTRAHYHRDSADDLEKCEYFVPVEWLATVARSQAHQEVGFFGNQNTICKPTAPRWRATVERLKQLFALPDRDK